MKRCLQCKVSFASSGWTCPTCRREPTRTDGHLTFAPSLAESNSTYPADAFEGLAAAPANNYWRVARNRLFTWAFRCYFPGARSFFEIGSGTGVILSAFRRTFPDLALSGSEIYVQGLKAVAARVAGAQLYQLDARELPFEDEFDVIGAFDMIEHVDEDEVVLAEMYRATRNGGGILISVPQHPFLWSQRDVALRHKRRYTRTELLEKITRAGFQPQRVTSLVSLPFPLMVLSAIRNRRSRVDYDPWAEMKIGRLTNGILSWILSLELMLVRAGLSLPFGGSLFVCARKAGKLEDQSEGAS